MIISGFFPAILLMEIKDQLFADKNSIVISKELALRMFGTTNNAIGKTIEWNQENFEDNYLITGVFEKFPSNSTIHSMQCLIMQSSSITTEIIKMG